jgi:hypothetical protein
MNGKKLELTIDCCIYLNTLMWDMASFKVGTWKVYLCSPTSSSPPASALANVRVSTMLLEHSSLQRSSTTCRALLVDRLSKGLQPNTPQALRCR